MRQSNPGRRPRGRPNRKHHVSPRSQTFDSSGPDVRVRGNAHQVYEKYLALARDATAAGDRVAAEGYYQFAEHYFRVLNDSTDPQPLHNRQGERHGDRRDRGDRQPPPADMQRPDQQPQPETPPLEQPMARAEDDAMAQAEQPPHPGNGADQETPQAEAQGDEPAPRPKRGRPRRRPASEGRAAKPNGSGEPAEGAEGEAQPPSEDAEVPAP